MKKYKNYLYSFTIPLIYAFILRAFFLDDLFSIAVGIVSFTFIILGPMCIGALIIALSPADKANNFVYAIFVPWIVIIVFLALTFVLKFEGAICLAMAAPAFLICSSLGGLIVCLIRRSRMSNKLNIAAALILPFLLSPLENSIEIGPSTYEADTYIIIDAPKEKIWENVVRVKEISVNEDNGKLSMWLGFPRPIRAELDSLHIGGKRRAIFDKGLEFNEVIKIYEHERKMNFSITPITGEIPPTTLDEHVTVGGKYFTVLDGTYELVPITERKYRLVLYSHFNMNTSFNFYSSLWAEWVMKDIQNNILEIIKKRSEG